MSTLKKLGKIILFPHIAILILFIPISISLLIFSMIFENTNDIVKYISYVFSFYSLLILCVRTPAIISNLKQIKNENKHIKRLLSDAHLQINISLYASLILNIIYIIFQLGLGFYHSSIWFYTMSVYYLLLAISRFFLLRYTVAYKPGEQMGNELFRYCACGWMLLVMNIALLIIIFFIVFQGRTFIHNEITTIAMATYTFASLSIAIVNFIKYRKYNSPVFSASKIISLVSACISMITLENAMITAFGGENDKYFRQIMLGITGVVVSLFIVIIAVFMIITSTKKLKILKNNKSSEN